MFNLRLLLLIPLFFACTPDPNPADPSPADTQPPPTEETQRPADTATLPDPPADTPYPCWDNWGLLPGAPPLEATEATHPFPPGESYVITLRSMTEPSFMGRLFERFLPDIPPLLLFYHPEDGTLHLQGGPATLISYGPDDTPDTPDDQYALLAASLDPTDCDYLIQLEGPDTAGKIEASADQVIVDISAVTELFRGARLEIEDATFTADHDSTRGRITQGRLRGIMRRDAVIRLIDGVELPFPISGEDAIGLLDPNDTGIVTMTFSFDGRRAKAIGWASNDKLLPIPRENSACCPPDLKPGDPIPLTRGTQGLQPDEEALAKRLIDTALLQPDRLDFIATQRIIAGEARLYLYSPRGHIYLTHHHQDGETHYRAYSITRDALDGEEISLDDPRNPIRNQDPTHLSSYEDFLEHCEPFALPDRYAQAGYTAGDPRLCRIPADKLSYPFGYERLFAAFDDPRAGDLVIEYRSYAGRLGAHGGLSVLQSRSPLILSGAGLQKPEALSTTTRCLGACDDSAFTAHLLDAVAKAVDIAPTLAEALQIETRAGVDRGFFSTDNRLAWQDGRPLSHLLSGTSPEYIVVIVSDGLTSIELLHEAFSDSYQLPAIRELMQRGLTFQHGAISNFPSRTYPGHNTIGSGAYAGHHGLINNSFYERESGAEYNVLTALFGTEAFVGSAQPQLPIETLHQAIHRSMGGPWHPTDNPDGVLTASLNNPSTLGADLATLERRTPTGHEVPEYTDTLHLLGQDWLLPTVAPNDTQGLIDNSTVLNFHALMLLNPKAGIPRPVYTIMNFTATDSVGHASGPHSDLSRQTIADLDSRIAIMIATLKEAGIYDQSLIVLTSDHGMELKDGTTPARLFEPPPPGVAFLTHTPFLYLRQLQVSWTDTAEGTLQLEVLDRDNSRPIPHAAIVLHNAEGPLTGMRTDAEGKAELRLPAREDLHIRVEKSGYSLFDQPLVSADD